MPGILGRKLEEEERRKRLAYEEHERRRMAVQPRVQEKKAGSETIGDAVRYGKDAAVVDLKRMASPPKEKKVAADRPKAKDIIDRRPPEWLKRHARERRYFPEQYEGFRGGPSGMQEEYFPELAATYPDVSHLDWDEGERLKGVEVKFKSLLEAEGLVSAARHIDLVKAETIDWLEANRPDWSEKVWEGLFNQMYHYAMENIDEYDIHGIAATGSMEPEIKGGDIVVVKQHDGNNLEVGDIVTFIPNYEGTVAGQYYGYTQENTTPFHRIVDVTPEGYVTMGDANAVPDPGHRQPEDIIYKYLYRIPLGDVPHFYNLAIKQLERRRKMQQVWDWTGEPVGHYNQIAPEKPRGLPDWMMR